MFSAKNYNTIVIAVLFGCFLSCFENHTESIQVHNKTKTALFSTVLTLKGARKKKQKKTSVFLKGNSLVQRQTSEIPSNDSKTLELSICKLRSIHFIPHQDPDKNIQQEEIRFNILLDIKTRKKDKQRIINVKNTLGKEKKIAIFHSHLKKPTIIHVDKEREAFIYPCLITKVEILK